MKINEIRDLSAADLDKKLAELKEELFNLRFRWQPDSAKTPRRFVRSRSPLPESRLYSARMKSTPERLFEEL